MSKKEGSRFVIDLYTNSSDEDSTFQQSEFKLPLKSNHVLNLKGIKRNCARADKNISIIQQCYIKVDVEQNQQPYTNNVTKTKQQRYVKTAVKDDVLAVSIEKSGDMETESESSVDTDDDDDDSSSSDSATSIMKQRRKAFSKKSNILSLKVKRNERKIEPITKTKRTIQKKIFTPIRSYNLRKSSPKTYLVEEATSDEGIKKPKKVIGARNLGSHGPRMIRSSSPKSFKLLGDISADRIGNIAQTSKDKVYDINIGTSCHQCRQKTLDTKTVCRGANCYGVHGQFCGPCLWNRYGESVAEALHDCEWTCPPCRGICNCSICRYKNGKVATGRMIAANYGFSSVAEYLCYEEVNKK